MENNSMGCDNVLRQQLAPPDVGVACCRHFTFSSESGGTPRCQFFVARVERNPTVRCVTKRDEARLGNFFLSQLYLQFIR